MTEAERLAAMDALPHQDWCRWWKEGDCCTCGAGMTEAERLAGVLTDRWPTHQGLLDEAAALIRSQAAEIEALQKQIANLNTVMIAAAEEIHAHWDAHCDAEGYGPANLMRRLEEGIPSEYGYTAGAFEALRADAEIGRQWRENSSLEKWFPFTAERMAKLEQWARDCRDQVLYPVAQQEGAIGKAADGLGQALTEFRLGPNARVQPLP